LIIAVTKGREEDERKKKKFWYGCKKPPLALPYTSEKEKNLMKEG